MSMSAFCAPAAYRRETAHGVMIVNCRRRALDVDWPIGFRTAAGSYPCVLAAEFNRDGVVVHPDTVGGMPADAVAQVLEVTCAEVSAFVAEHPAWSRAGVLDEALREIATLDRCLSHPVSAAGLTPDGQARAARWRARAEFRAAVASSDLDSDGWWYADAMLDEWPLDAASLIDLARGLAAGRTAPRRTPPPALKPVG